MPQTLPSPDLLASKINKVGRTYSASLLTILFAEEYHAIRKRLVSAEASVNSKDLYIGGVETITPTRAGSLARLALDAGTGLAGEGPLNLQPGPLLAVPEAYTLEVDPSGDLYYTDGVPVRFQIAVGLFPGGVLLQADPIPGTPQADFLNVDTGLFGQSVESALLYLTEPGDLTTRWVAFDAQDVGGTAVKLSISAGVGGGPLDEIVMGGFSSLRFPAADALQISGPTDTTLNYLLLSDTSDGVRLNPDGANERLELASPDNADIYNLGVGVIEFQSSPGVDLGRLNMTAGDLVYNDLSDNFALNHPSRVTVANLPGAIPGSSKVGTWFRTTGPGNTPTLPLLSTVDVGFWVTIKDRGHAAGGAHTVSPNAGDVGATIDGAASYTISTNWQSFDFIKVTATEWEVR